VIPREHNSTNDARWLSRRLSALGDRCPEIWEELDASGFGEAARIVRQAHRDLAATPAAYQQVVTYWTEYAKERLAGLAQPMDILRGRLPEIAAYRSEFLDRLRADASAGKLPADGPIASPQIEPTIKCFTELLPDDPLKAAVHERVRAAKRTAALAGEYSELADFAGLSSSAKYDLLVQRYAANLEPAGFELAARTKRAAAFKVPVANGALALVFVDASYDGIDGGQLFSDFAITTSEKPVALGALPRTALATFSPGDLVPGFAAMCWFDAKSYAQLCFSCDSVAWVVKTIRSQLDQLLSAECSE
jgi:hypothetical protein